MHKHRYIGAGIPGIPPAPIGKLVYKPVDLYFQSLKQKLDDRLPLLTKEQVMRAKYPFYTLLFHDMLSEGFLPVVKELDEIVHLQKQEQKGRSLCTEEDKMVLVVETLKECEKRKNMGEHIGAKLRTRLAESLIIDFDDAWLAIKFLEGALKICEEHEIEDAHFQKVKAQAHCILASIALKHPEYFVNTKEAIVNSLVICRELSKDYKSWQFKRKVASVKVATPATLHGLREEYENIDACSAPLYVFATTLLNEMYFNISKDLIQENSLRGNEKLARTWVEKALELAYEVRQSAVLDATLLRYGKFLLDTDEVQEALPYFHELEDRAIFHSDMLTQAVAINNIGLCFDRLMDPVRALENFNKQKEISQEFKLHDAEGDAFFEMGKLLLHEGQLWEAEECFQRSHQKFRDYSDSSTICASTNSTSTISNDMMDATWAFIGIAAGHNLWSRLAGLCRSEDPQDLRQILRWKIRKRPLPVVKNPRNVPDLISDFYDPKEFVTKIPSLWKKKDTLTKTLSKRKSPMSGYRKKLLEEDNYVFETDMEKSVDQFMGYSQSDIWRDSLLHSAKTERAKSMARDLRSLSMRQTISKPGGYTKNVINYDELGS